MPDKGLKEPLDCICDICILQDKCKCRPSKIQKKIEELKEEMKNCANPSYFKCEVCKKRQSTIEELEDILKDGDEDGKKKKISKT